MKLYNTIIIWDVYCVAESEETARAAVRQHIREEGLRASEEVGLEVRKPTEVRAAWEAERPIVASDISDTDFDTLKGKTTSQVFSMLHMK